MENELLQLLVQNLARLDEKEETDRQGVFKILGILENVISLEPKYAQDIALKTDILPWLLKRLQTKGFDANIAYTSEILSILLQNDRGKQKKKKKWVFWVLILIIFINKDIRLKVGELDGIDVLLRALAVWLIHREKSFGFFSYLY